MRAPRSGNLRSLRRLRLAPALNPPPVSARNRFLRFLNRRHTTLAELLVMRGVLGSRNTVPPQRIDRIVTFRLTSSIHPKIPNKLESLKLLGIGFDVIPIVARGRD